MPSMVLKVSTRDRRRRPPMLLTLICGVGFGVELETVTELSPLIGLKLTPLKLSSRTVLWSLRLSCSIISPTSLQMEPLRDTRFQILVSLWSVGSMGGLGLSGPGLSPPVSPGPAKPRKILQGLCPIFGSSQLPSRKPSISWQQSPISQHVLCKGLISWTCFGCNISMFFSASLDRIQEWLEQQCYPRDFEPSQPGSLIMHKSHVASFYRGVHFCVACGAGGHNAVSSQWSSPKSPRQQEMPF